MFYLPITAGLVALIVLIVTRRVQLSRRIRALGEPCPEPPNVYHIPFGIGRFIYVGQRAANNTFIQLWPEWWAKYGKTLKLSAFGSDSIFTDEPENVRYVLSEGVLAGKIGMGEDFHAQFSEFLGDSVFTLDGVRWRTARAILRKQFTRNKLADLEVIEFHVQRLIRIIKSHQGGPTPVLELIHRFTLDTSMGFLLGTDENSVENPVNDFSHAWDRVFEIIDQRARAGGLWKLIVPTKPLLDAMAVLNGVAYPHIDRAIQRRRNGEKINESFLDCVTEDTLDREEIRGHLMTIILGGRDTAALTLTNALHALAVHPEVYEKARAEVLAIVGPNEAPTFEQIKELRYMRAIINETLRLWPILPYTRKAALQDLTLPVGGKNGGPVAVLKGSEIYYSANSMHRRPEHWGLDAAVFRPERFVENGGTHKPWTYFPFSGGPRICVGMQFAQNEMHYFLTRIFQNFEMLKTTKRELTYKMMILMVPDTEVPINFIEKLGNDEKGIAR